MVHCAVRVLVGGGFNSFPATRPAVEQAFIEVTLRFTDFRRIQTEVVQISEGYIDFDLVGYIEQ